MKIKFSREFKVSRRETTRAYQIIFIKQVDELSQNEKVLPVTETFRHAFSRTGSFLLPLSKFTTKLYSLSACIDNPFYTFKAHTFLYGKLGEQEQALFPFRHTQVGLVVRRGNAFFSFLLNSLDSKSHNRLKIDLNSCTCYVLSPKAWTHLSDHDKKINLNWHLSQFYAWKSWVCIFKLLNFDKYNSILVD